MLLITFSTGVLVHARISSCRTFVFRMIIYKIYVAVQQANDDDPSKKKKKTLMTMRKVII